MLTWIAAGIYISEVLILYTYISDIFHRKYKPLKTILIGCLIFVAPFVLNALWNNIAVNILAFLVASALFFSITFKTNVLQGVLHGVIITGMMFATELLCLYLISYLFDMNSFYAYRESITIYVLDTITSKLLFLIVCKLFSRLKLKDKEKIYKTPVSYFVYAVSSLCLSACLIWMNGQTQFSAPLQITIVVAAAFLLMSLIFIFISYEKNAAKNAELLRLKTETQKQELDEKYYQILQNQNENMHTFAHDTKHHLSAILSLSDNEEINRYIHSIYQDLEKYSAVGKTGNKALDIILNEYRSLCAVRHIQFETEIRTANLSFIEPAKLTSLLNNMLDNAVEATQQCKNGKILLSINRIENFDVVNCINNCNTPPRFENSMLKTTKEDKSLHGFGSKSMDRVVKFYNGILNCKYLAETKEFEVTIIFPVAMENNAPAKGKEASAHQCKKEAQV